MIFFSFQVRPHFELKEEYEGGKFLTVFFTYPFEWKELKNVNEIDRKKK